MSRAKPGREITGGLKDAINLHDKFEGVEMPRVANQRLFTVGAAAHYLGISDDTLRKYADLGQIPAYRFINGHRAFKIEDLNKLIDELPMWNDRTNDTTRAGRDREVS